MKNLVLEKVGIDTYSFFSEYIDLEAKDTLIVSTTNSFNILNNKNEINSIVNLSRVNDIRFLNKFFENINSKLSSNGKFICCLETFTARKERKPIGRFPLVRNIYFGMEFIFMRVFPKVAGFKNIYFFFTRGRNRLLSKAEVLGRLVSCGFEIEGFQNFNGLLYVITKKIKEPEFDMNASYGPFYKMPRVGKDGKIIGVYKLRTMHPYAEYLQKYVYETNGTISGDKANNDFRLTPWGKVFRKLWLDELPMIINLLKGEVKLVGVRPLSVHKFSMYPEEAQKKRILFKPGLVPPFYADYPNGLEELVASEMKYLNAYEINPFQTDVKYFFKALNNILFKNRRSA